MSEYKIEKVDKEKLNLYWDTAIGLQKVDNLEPSQYLIELSQKNIKGQIEHSEIETLLYKKYETQTAEEIVSRKKEADIVTNRMTELLGMNGRVMLTPEYLKGIHKFLFQGIYEHAGKFREYNIYKNEEILNGDTVKYANYFALEDTLRYDLTEEKNKKYSLFSKSEIIENITDFTSRVWQVHPFMEGNTRTTALFIEQYLNQLGFNVDNALFKEKSVFFRNALVRANYADYSRGINEDDKFLKKFFVNLLYRGEYKLQSRDLILPGKTSVLDKLHPNQKMLSEEKRDDFVHVQEKERGIN